MFPTKFDYHYDIEGCTCYHKWCHRAYTKVKLDPEDMPDEHTIEHHQSILTLVSITDNDLLKENKAFDTSILLAKNKQTLSRHHRYRKLPNRKTKIASTDGLMRIIMFKPQTDRSKPELAYSSDISV